MTIKENERYNVTQLQRKENGSPHLDRWISPQISLRKMDITMESPQLSGSFPNYKENIFFLYFSNGVTTSKWISPQIFLRKMGITMESPQLSGSFPNYKDKRIFFSVFFSNGAPTIKWVFPIKARMEYKIHIKYK